MSSPIDIIDWLNSDASHDLDSAELVAQLAKRLTASGVQLERLVLHIRTIHPEIVGSTITWFENGTVETYHRERGIESSHAFVESPLPQLMEMLQPLLVRLDEQSRKVWAAFEVFRSPNLSEFLFVPLRNAKGLFAFAFFGTSGRFSESDIALLQRIAPALRGAVELRALRSIVLSLLDTYVGTGTAQRILAGQIRRGQVESFEVALMLCDLRGFTTLSNRLPSERVVELLDAYFDAMVPAIAASGGEVLKFMGDGVLAFFHRDDPSNACVAAFESSVRALEALSKVSVPDAELHAGIALHYGKVSYGNIGSGQRLDFTLIGPDVNLLSRIQGICSSSGQGLLMSERFATLLGTARTAAFGHHALKGFPVPVPLYLPYSGN